MNQAAHNKLISFIWSIADDCLRDVYVRGKYRDVILPMVVLRRLDTLLEPTKAAVLEEQGRMGRAIAKPIVPSDERPRPKGRGITSFRSHASRLDVTQSRPLDAMS